MEYEKKFNADYLNKQNTAGVRPPCMSLKELSQDTGTPYTTLTRKFKSSKDKPEMIFKNGGTMLYSLRLLTQWYNSNFNKHN